MSGLYYVPMVESDAKHRGPIHDLLVVGAGISGLAAARETQQAHWNSLILEKSRAPSGRAATRYMMPKPRAQQEEEKDYKPMFSVPDAPRWTPEQDDDQNWFAKLDHGAHYFTARHPRFQRLVDGALQTGWLREWTRHFAQWDDDETYIPALDTGAPRYVPLRGMSRLGRELGRPLNIECSTLVTSIEHTSQGWDVFERGGRCWHAKRLVLSMPAPQVAALFEDYNMPSSHKTENALAAARNVRYEPCWSAGFVLEEDIKVDWLGLRLPKHPVLAWISREHTKREDPEHPPALVVQAQSAWSANKLESLPEDIWAELAESIESIVGPVKVKKAFAHRWMFANPTQRAPYAYHWDEDYNLGWCGDWCTPDEHEARIEAAFLSGWRLAQSMLRT